jgi:hypothetical protein
MNWWDEIGNYVAFFGDTPALGVDMATNGPNANHVGYDLAFGLQATPTPIDVYPSEPSLAEPGA